MASTASSTHVRVAPDNTGLWHLRQTDAAAATVSARLQDDLERHHVFFNDGGFHDHIVHHLLSLYGTGASAADIEQAYVANASYQRAARPPHTPRDGSPGPDDAGWFAATTGTGGAAHLGSAAYYGDFLRFFQQDIQRVSEEAPAEEVPPLAAWQTVVRRRLLAGTPDADDMLARLFAGFLHPALQLMYGVEWAQPAIVAQGLAQAAVHRPRGLGDFLFEAERMAAVAEAADVSMTATTPLRALYEAVAATPTLATAAHADDANKVDGVLERARDAMLAVAARVSVPPTEAAVAALTAEMAETCVYVAASAALHPRKHPRFDFFLIHHVNCIPFFLAIASASWVPVAAKARLLAWKIRLDLVQYVARACPPLIDPSAFATYLDAAPTGNDPPPEATTTADGISPAAAAAAARLFRLDEDGHAIKLVRATALAERAVRQPAYANTDWRILTSDAVWDGIYRLETDSVQGPGEMWVRTTGLEEAWKNIPDKPSSTL